MYDSRTWVVDVSCKVSSEPSEGHMYWFHKSFQDAAISSGLGAHTIGPATQHSSWVDGLLTYGWPDRHFSSVFLMKSSRRDGEKVLQLCRKISNINGPLLHFYEGGFREFLLLQRLLRQNSAIKFCFNFNLTDPWHSLLRDAGEGVLRRTVVGALSRMLTNTSSRGVYTVETGHLQRLFEKKLKVSLPVYPLFSATPASSPSHLDEKRSIDITFFPEGPAEADLCLKALGVLQQEQALVTRFTPRWGYKLSDDLRARATALGVEIIESVLGNEEYFNLYAQTKIAVFPYTSEYYKLSSSGRYLDAKKGAAILVAPSGSSLGDDIISAGIGEIFDGTPGSLVTALEIALRKNYASPHAVLSARDAIDIILASVPVHSGSQKIGSGQLLAEFGFAALVNTCLSFRLALGRHLDAVGFAKARQKAKGLFERFRNY